MAPDEAGALHCPRCGAIVPAVEIPCPACGALLPADGDACPKCGEPVSVFGQVMARHADSRKSPLWLEQARGHARGVREQEEQASSRRFEALQAIDRRRLEAEARDALAQQRQDRLTLRWGLGIALALALVFLGLALFVTLR